MIVMNSGNPHLSTAQLVIVGRLKADFPALVEIRFGIEASLIANQQSLFPSEIIYCHQFGLLSAYYVLGRGGLRYTLG
jgi:hypothetical protein